MARVVARAMTAADMMDLIVGRVFSGADGGKGEDRLWHQNQGVVKTAGVRTRRQ